MNLTAFFKKDAALVDHAWMSDGIVHPGAPQLDLSRVRRNNDTKPDLELEWGLGGPTVDIDKPAGVVERTLPDDAGADASSAIVFARDMMNRGHRLSKVASALKGKFGADTLRRARNGLEDVFRGAGVIGRVAVDGRGYKSCAEALKAASASPYKRFIRFVVGCECGEPHMMPCSCPGPAAELVSTGNPTDDFLASGAAEKPRMAAHCRSTMLPVVATVGDLDPSYMDEALVEVMNVVGMPAGVKQQVMASKASSLAKVRAAFRWLDRQADEEEKGKYSEKVSSREERVAQAPMDFDIPDAVLPGPVSVSQDVAPMGVDDISFEPVDVDMGQDLGPEFEGSDVVPLDEPPAVSGILDVEMLARPGDEMGFLAGERTAMEFPTQEALDKYLKDHPDANRSNHKVKQTDEKAPAKKGEPNKDFGPHNDFGFDKERGMNFVRQYLRRNSEWAEEDLEGEVSDALTKEFGRLEKSVGHEVDISDKDFDNVVKKWTKDALQMAKKEFGKKKMR